MERNPYYKIVKFLLVSQIFCSLNTLYIFMFCLKNKVSSFLLNIETVGPIFDTTFIKTVEAFTIDEIYLKNLILGGFRLNWC